MEQQVFCEVCELLCEDGFKTVESETEEEVICLFCANDRGL